MTDLTATVGSVVLPNPVMTAAGTAGHGTELARYLDLGSLGAFVAKSLAAFEWPGNPAPRLAPVRAGMLNSVGLQGPGLAHWLAVDVPALRRAGARRVVASLWGRTVADYGAAGAMVAAAPGEVVAVEVNLSCPNLEGGRHQFAQSVSATHDAVAAVVAAGPGRPVWAKLTAMVADLPAIAAAASAAGAEAVTLVNTLLGMAVDLRTRRPNLGAGGGGLSGPAIHPVAVRAVYEVRAAHPSLPIVGVGGVACAEDAVELLLAGADAVQVGTATFADPRAPMTVLRDLRRWCDRHGVASITELVSAAHR